MRLQKLFLLFALLLTALLTALTLHDLQGAFAHLRQGEKGLEAIQNLRLVLVAAEMASRERGPSNGVLGDDLPHDPRKLELLASARQATDIAFTDALSAAPTSTDTPEGLLTVLHTAQEQLRQGRQAVDAIAGQERAHRSPERLRSAIGQMFQVIDDLAPASLRLTQAAQVSYPQETNLLQAARQAALLREYAGRLGSLFTVALTKRERVEPQEYEGIEQLLGRIAQQRASLMERIQADAADNTVDRATQTMQSRYCESAIPYVKDLLTTGLKDAHYATDAAGFAQRYVPDMDSIIALRNVLIDQARQRAQAQLDDTRHAAYWSGFWAIVSLALLASNLLLLHFRVIRPLRQTMRLILDVADGRQDVTIPTPRYRDEISDVLQAITVLRDNNQARAALEEERRLLLVRLKDQAVTDFLTDLPNRRGFFDAADPLFTTLRRQGHPVSLALFDVDHFKRINDQHGHDVGDRVLKHIAQLCRSRLRSGDIVARFGGEEFLFLMPYCQQEAALKKAESLRVLIEQTPITLPDGQTLAITASFGVDMCMAYDESVLDTIKRCDQKLYLAKDSGRNKIV